MCEEQGRLGRGSTSNQVRSSSLDYPAKHSNRTRSRGLHQLNHPCLLFASSTFHHQQPPPYTMSSDWTHSYCLTCDKQTDSTTYCSESCRLAEYEQSSNPSTGPSSPAFSGPGYPWGYSKPAPGLNKLYLSPACDFSHSAAQSSQRRSSLALPQRVLSPSSSHASLCSMKSNSSASTEAAMQLSDAARKELLAYASSFENARSSRRQSH